METAAEFLRDGQRRWRLCDAFIKRYGFVSHQIDGYDQFVESILPEIVKENSDIVACESGRQHRVKFGDITVKKPCVTTPGSTETVPVTPQDCRLRRLSYNVLVTGNVLHEIYATDDDGNPTELLQRNEAIEVHFFSLPCMLRSKFCHLSGDSDVTGEDTLCPGGFFLINGVEKVMMPQLKLRGNVPLVFATKGTVAAKYTYGAEVRSIHARKWRSTSTLKMMIRADHSTRTAVIVVLLPFVMKRSTPLEIPLITLIRCAEAVHGWDRMSVEDIMHRFFLGDTTPDARDPDVRDLIVSSLRVEPFASYTNAENLEWLERNGSKERRRDKQKKYAEHILRNEYLPHVAAPEDRLVWIGILVRRLVAVELGRIPSDCRDDNQNKRLDGPGPLLALLFRQLFRNHLKQIRVSLTRAIAANKLINVTDYLHPRRIEVGLAYHFSTGTWSLNRTSQNGVVQPMNRMSSCAVVSHLRRCTIPLSREGRAPKVRQLHPSDFRIFCPAETPEGASVGLVKNLALLARVSVGCEATWVARVVRTVLAGADPGPVPVMVNGATVCTVADGAAAAADLRRCRRGGSLLPETCVTFTAFEGVHVASEGGRLVSPCLVAAGLGRLVETVAAAAPHDLWDALLDAGVVEFLDKREERFCVVAGSVDQYLRDPAGFTHVEVDPTAFLGTTTACIPFSDHNQSPRNMYQASMHKQAIAMPMTNYALRFDAHMYVMHTPTRPLVTTRVSEHPLINFELPAGFEPVVAVACYGGENQEDSLILNKSSVDLGMATITAFATHAADCRRGSTDNEYFVVPGEDVIGRKGKANYGKLGADGFVPLQTRVEPGDVIVGRVLVRSRTGSREPRDTMDPDPEFVRDRSLVLRSSEGGVVDSIVVLLNKENKPSVRVRIAQTRKPAIGDKFSSRHGQKGTVGCIMRREDMPFTAEGITPDIIVNPHALPSRMTIGHLVECLAAKACALRGSRMDGTPFQGTTVAAVARELKRHGMPQYGKEVMHNGFTGERMDAMVFIGPVYYQRLKHMVADKIHSLPGNGPRTALTRQPLEGRSRNGGLRFGEMEKDGLLSHGAAMFAHDKLNRCSDITTVYVCQTCGNIGEAPPPKAIAGARGTDPYCRSCDRRDTVRRVEIPYATKLLIQELEAMHVRVRPTLRLRS